MIFDIKKFENINVKTEVLSGLTVALALVPEAVAVLRRARSGKTEHRGYGMGGK